jgi:PAS domain S-box-containing protein
MRETEGKKSNMPKQTKPVTIPKSTKKMQNTTQDNNEQKFRDLANLIPLIVFEIDNNGSFVFTNSPTSSITGYSSIELKHKKIFQLLSKADRTNLMSIMNKKRLVNNEDDNYYTAIRKDGSEFPVILKMTSIATDGVIAGWRGILVDLTERERNEARRLELEQKAVVSSHMASIGELASGIAHEVNNPLASIVLYSQLLMEENLPNNIKRDVMSIYESAVRATNIIRRLLTFARQQLQKRIPVNINDIVEVTLELRKYALETSNIKVKTILDPDLPLIMADAVQLQEVFLNIILNAETEMKLYRGKGNLEIKTEKSNGKIIVSFTDDGPGISKENLSKIFNPFFTTRQVGEGTGLGLSICHGIIIEHDGKIYAESKRGKGATFYIELPIIKRPKRHKQKGSVPTKQRKITRSRILVVDDEIGILDSLSRILAKQGHKVETTDNCVDALDMIKTEKYDYILLDVKLPGMSGIEMFNEIKKHDRSIVKKLAIITGDTMEPATQEFLEYAKVPCFVKPFDTKNFIREINSLINGE